MTMKAFLCFVSVMIPAITFGEDRHAPPLVTTSGTAEIRVVPDLADLYFEITARDADQENALKRQATRSKRVLEVLRAAGIAETEIQTELIVVRRLVAGRDYGGGGGFFSVGVAETNSEKGDEVSEDKVQDDDADDPIATGKNDFVVTQAINCNLRDIAKITEITLKVIAAGANPTRGATLRTSELRKYRDEARIKAVRFAKEKATALANELGAKVGKPYTIVEGEGLGWWGQYNTNGGQGSSNDAPPPVNEAQSTFAPGTISVSATISVSFVLE